MPTSSSKVLGTTPASFNKEQGIVLTFSAENVTANDIFKSSEQTSVSRTAETVDASLNPNNHELSTGYRHSEIDLNAIPLHEDDNESHNVITDAIRMKDCNAKDTHDCFPTIQPGGDDESATDSSLVGDLCTKSSQELVSVRLNPKTPRLIDRFLTFIRLKNSIKSQEETSNIKMNITGTNKQNNSSIISKCETAAVSSIDNKDMPTSINSTINCTRDSNTSNSMTPIAQTCTQRIDSEPVCENNEDNSHNISREQMHTCISNVLGTQSTSVAGYKEVTNTCASSVDKFTDKNTLTSSERSRVSLTDETVDGISNQNNHELSAGNTHSEVDVDDILVPLHDGVTENDNGITKQSVERNISNDRSITMDNTIHFTQNYNTAQPRIQTTFSEPTSENSDATSGFNPLEQMPRSSNDLSTQLESVTEQNELILTSSTETPTDTFNSSKQNATETVDLAPNQNDHELPAGNKHSEIDVDVIPLHEDDNGNDNNTSLPRIQTMCSEPTCENNDATSGFNLHEPMPRSSKDTSTETIDVTSNQRDHELSIGNKHSEKEEAIGEKSQRTLRKVHFAKQQRNKTEEDQGPQWDVKCATFGSYEAGEFSSFSGVDLDNDQVDYDETANTSLSENLYGSWKIENDIYVRAKCLSGRKNVNLLSRCNSTFGRAESRRKFNMLSKENVNSVYNGVCNWGSDRINIQKSLFGH